MKKLKIIVVFIVLRFFCFSQTNDTLYIHYFESPPLSSTKNGEASGVEISIITNYLQWLKNNKNINLIPKYLAFKNFDVFYNSVKNSSKNTIGLGAVTITNDRLKEIDFTSPYLKNVAFCVTNGNATDIKIKNQAEVAKTLATMSALTITNTTLDKYVNELKKNYLPELKLIAQTNETKILDEISMNVLYFGYVDAISFWYYVKTNPGKFLKNQKVLIQSKEDFGFILPKGSNQKNLFDVFFGNFKKNKAYTSILERYLGSYMSNIMAIK